jgi:hypothetical protein
MMNLSISETEMFSIAEVPQQHFHRYGYVVVNETCAKKKKPLTVRLFVCPSGYAIFLEKKNDRPLFFFLFLLIGSRNEELLEAICQRRNKCTRKEKLPTGLSHHTWMKHIYIVPHWFDSKIYHAEFQCMPRYDDVTVVKLFCQNLSKTRDWVPTKQVIIPLFWLWQILGANQEAHNPG